MATFNVEGFDEVLLELEKAKDGFEDRAKAAVQAGGLVAANLLYDAAPHRTNAMRESFKMTEPARNFEDGIYVDVYPAGTQPNGPHKKASNETVGFANEYGSSTQEAKPFMRPTLENHSGEITAAMAAVLGMDQED
ncbi:MAG: hypothetical protein EOM10_17280 [Opitutae bacterium]|nr:hypothetical protein [Opitutae bacterium]